MIFTTDGIPLQGKIYALFWDLYLLFVTGITGGYGGDRRVEFILSPEVREQGFHDFVIESSCNGMFGVPWNGGTYLLKQALSSSHGFLI